MDKTAFLIDKGWSTWYNPDYWVHPKIVQDETKQDYTNYGMSLEQAYEFETNNQEPFKGQFLGHLGGVRW